MQNFDSSHLAAGPLKEVFERYARFAEELDADLPSGPEKTTALWKLRSRRTVRCAQRWNISASTPDPQYGEAPPLSFGRVGRFRASIVALRPCTARNLHAIWHRPRVPFRAGKCPQPSGRFTSVSTPSTPPPVRRRSIAKAALWAAPTIVVSTAAPAMATSLRKDPGINGWVNNNYRTGSCGSRSSDIAVTSNSSGATPDGAPFGLYIYDTQDVTAVTGATITYWVLGDHATTGSTSITWTSDTGHSTCWSYQGRVGTMQKPDGLTYTGYRWMYTCTIDPHATTTGSDGVARVILGNFVVSTNRFEQPAGSCNKLNFWTERAITLDGVAYTFQRRAGTDGTYTTGGRARVAPEAPVADDTEHTAVS